MYGLILSALLALNVESTIDSVVVYPDQAMVVRRATANISGSGQFVFPDLPGILDDNSVRIRATGLKIGEVQVKPGYSAEPTPRMKQLEDSLKKLDRQARVYTNEKAMLAAKMEFLGSVKVAGPDLMSKELSAGKVDAGNWNAAIGFLGTQMMAVSSRQLEVDDLAAALTKVRYAVSQELSDVRARVENRKTVVADVVALEGGSHEVTLSYQVPGSVSWEPYYELRASPTDETVTLAYYVRMEQSTNEDWNGVSMMLSTARPAAGGVAPEPKPWYVDLAEAQSYTLQLKTNRAITQQNIDGWNMSKAEVQQQVPRQVPVFGEASRVVLPTEAGISLQYAMPGRMTLKSGEDAKKFFLHEEKMPADFSYYVYPRVRTASYLRAKVQNSSDFVFLGGNANTYVGDEFTGQTTLANVAPGESANPSFGIDDRMKVHHQRTRLFTSRTGLFSKRTRVDFEFKTTIENYHTKPVTMTLVEQIPTSAHDDIKVSLTKLEPKGAVENKENGTYTFTFEMKPQEKLVVSIGYAVEYPTKTKIAGLYDAINPARALELEQKYEMKKK
jgi:uncharacterized protein (TIGR02231 family)